METEAAPRFVRCPECLQVLAEVPDVLAYRCGGCSTLLQGAAKNLKRNVKREESGQPERKVELLNGSNHISEDEEPNTSVGNSSPNESHFESEDCDLEGPGAESEASSASTKLLHSETIDSLPSLEQEPLHLLGEAEGRCSTSPVAADGPLRENSNTLSVSISSPREQSREAVTRGFGSMRSRGTFGSTEYASHRSEFSAVLGGSQDASDGSISSYDGLEDQFADRYAHSLKPTHQNGDTFAVSREKLGKEQFLLDSIRNMESVTMTQLAQSLGKQKFNAIAVNEKCLDHDELKEPTRIHHPPKNVMRVERKDLPPKVPLHGRSSQAAGFGNGTFSSSVHEDYKWDLGFCPAGRLEYHRQEKMKLLRVIRDLQDQLDESCNLESSANGRDNTHLCYYHKAPVEETWHESNYPMYAVRSRLGGSPAKQSKFARMAFSGEAAECWHCHTQDQKLSAPLPPVLCHNKGICTSVHSGCECCNPHSSCDQRLKDRHVMGRYMRERHVVAKKHIQPNAGGAPFITCHHCSELLQIPRELLLFRRRCYKLRCGACSTLLKFSVQNRTHITPYSPNGVDQDPAPSEVDEYSEVRNRRSTASYSSHDKKRKEFLRNQFRNKYKDPVEEAYGSARPSPNKSKPEKFSSEIEVHKQQSSCSPLHSLMGYSSPSLVIRGTGMSRAGTRS